MTSPTPPTIGPTARRVCAGPIYFADQGIEVCTACGGCVCCDFSHVDHSAAEYECFTDREGRCHLKAHADRGCQKDKP